LREQLLVAAPRRSARSQETGCGLIGEADGSSSLRARAIANKLAGSTRGHCARHCGIRRDLYLHRSLALDIKKEKEEEEGGGEKKRIVESPGLIA